MKILSWNCRELGNPRTVHDLHCLVKEKRPDLVFLMKTKLDSHRWEFLNRKLKFEGCFAVNPIGRSGGLALLWRLETGVSIQSYSRFHINSMIKAGHEAIEWQFTGFYGYPEASKRQGSWDSLVSLKLANHIPWFTCGDFNEILAQDEKRGGNERSEAQMNKFRQALEMGELFDVGWNGSRFTWCNKHRDETFTVERLDRGLANKGWLDHFKALKVENMVARSLDHRPLCFSYGQQSPYLRGGHQLFKYEVAWGKDEGCRNIIREVWLHESPNDDSIRNVQHNLKMSRVSLSKWRRSSSSDFDKEIKEKSAILKQLQDDENQHNEAEIVKL